jgi:hypothetical protein
MQNQGMYKVIIKCFKEIRREGNTNTHGSESSDITF